ncbi:MAG: sugar transferase, partial [Desulfobacula sp.]|nr:sugar transferase [Desulfobacula sp.]
AGICLIILTPYLFICLGALKMKSKGPGIFIDKRVGKNGKIFNLYKFRTMYSGALRGRVTQNDLRVTFLGRILRSTSIDEFPQLINILKGDMSIVGPRPDLPSNSEKYDKFVMQRLSVRPGLTGLAQCRGRNSISWAERYRHDIEYVKNISFFLDLMIIFETFKIVISRKSINVDK